jgi:hypothetical protein
MLILFNILINYLYKYIGSPIMIIMIKLSFWILIYKPPNNIRLVYCIKKTLCWHTNQLSDEIPMIANFWKIRAGFTSNEMVPIASCSLCSFRIFQFPLVTSPFRWWRKDKAAVQNLPYLYLLVGPSRFKFPVLWLRIVLTSWLFAIHKTS